MSEAKGEGLARVEAHDELIGPWDVVVCSYRFGPYPHRPMADAIAGTINTAHSQAVREKVREAYERAAKAVEDTNPEWTYEEIADDIRKLAEGAS